MHRSASSLPENNLENTATWEEVEAHLRPFAKGWVAAAKVPAWQGQEDDVVDDIVQVALLRLLSYTQSAERRRAQPIRSLVALAVTILRNSFNDLVRRERRLLHVFTEDQLSEITSVEGVDSSEKVIENLTEEKLFREVADKIARFPQKQKEALLIDLANRIDFNDIQTPLQEAFREAGIQLEDYRVSLPANSVIRNRQAALLAIAYKRLRQEMISARDNYMD